MSQYIHKSHNVSLIMYHFVCPAKYRKVIFSDDIDNTLRDVCIEISNRYDIIFLEIGTDKDHVHFLVQSVPKIRGRGQGYRVLTKTFRTAIRSLCRTQKTVNV